MSTPSLATVEATSAIWSGVTNVSPCPYAAFASSTSSTKPPGSSPRPFVSCDAAVGRSNGSGAPNPSRSANSAMFSPPVASPTQREVDVEEISVA